MLPTWVCCCARATLLHERNTTHHAPKWCAETDADEGEDDTDSHLARASGVPGLWEVISLCGRGQIHHLLRHTTDSPHFRATLGFHLCGACGAAGRWAGRWAGQKKFIFGLL